MPDYQVIYRDRAADYDALVSHEDHAGSLPRALAEEHPLAGAVVVEFGAGTGRVTRTLAPRVAAIHAFDASPAMLAVARRGLLADGARHVTLAAGRNESMPCIDAVADLVVAGWTFGHMTGWYPADWRERATIVLGEVRRVLRPGGTAIIIETLGTGRTEPQAPSPALAEFQEWLETAHGFRRRVIRTDYRFPSVAEAERLTRFFFGDLLADRIVREQLTILPECTGMWVRTFTD